MPDMWVDNTNIAMTPFRVQSLLIPINQSTFFDGEVDRAITLVAGHLYSQQAREVLHELREGDTFIARRGRARHLGQFDDIIYVIDNLRVPLNIIVLNGLKAAENDGLSIIAMSAMRTGNQQGRVEKNLEDTARQIKLGFQQFKTLFPESPLRVIIALRRPDDYVRRFKTYLLD